MNSDTYAISSYVTNSIHRLVSSKKYIICALCFKNVFGTWELIISTLDFETYNATI